MPSGDFVRPLVYASRVEWPTERADAGAHGSRSDRMTRGSSAVWRACLWLLCACLYWASAPGAAIERADVVLMPGASAVDLAPQLRYHHDPDDRQDLDAAWQRVETGMTQLPDGNDAFGFQRGTFWFHARVVNHEPREPRWMLVQEYPLSDEVDAYVRYADGRVVHHAGGDHRPFDSRSVRYRHPNFSLDLPVGEPVDVLVRVRSQSSMQVPLQLYTPKAFTEVSRDAQLAIGVYYGIMLALFFYNLVLWLSLRDASYFWYLCHVTAFGLVLFTLNGLGFEYLWPESPWLADHMVPISICLALVAMLQFSRTFLELPRRWPQGNVLLLALMTFFALFGIASVLLPLRISTPIASRAVLVGVFGIVIATIIVLRRGYAPARLLLLAWSAFLLGTAAFTLLAFGILPKNFATEYGVQIGSALEMLLLSIALGHRYAALRNANQRIVAEANQKLERKVAQRTQEVRSTLLQLEEAHTRLRDSSRRDGLTGLYNRTWFHEGFRELARQAQDGDRPLAVLMIDLDHFKGINDRFGHLAGDDCLRWAARRIGRVLRPHDALLARFGGEEFIAAIPGCDLRAAAEVAETIRHALSEEPCGSGDDRIRVTASIGVHVVAPPDAAAVDSALALADRALYAAKANGRNCVELAPA